MQCTPKVLSGSRTRGRRKDSAGLVASLGGLS
jgi:hypothetical protein